MGLLPIFGVPNRNGQTIILSNGSTGVDISTLFSAEVWSSNIKKRVIIPSGVTRGSTVRTTPAISTGTGRGGLLDIIIDGTIEGCGAPATTTLVAGLDGGDCFLAEQSGVTVFGSGLIRSGGGAGGKGGNGSTVIFEGPFFSTSSPTYGWYETTFDGGGYTTAIWNGTNVTPGTSGGITYYKPNNIRRYFDSQPGTSLVTEGFDIARYYTATTSSGNSGRGQGHDGDKSNGIVGGPNSGLSGDGGDWGASGTAGAAGTVSSGTAAGLAGFALKNTSNIINLFTGTLQGRTG